MKKKKNYNEYKELQMKYFFIIFHILLCANY